MAAAGRHGLQLDYYCEIWSRYVDCEVDEMMIVVRNAVAAGACPTNRTVYRVA